MSARSLTLALFLAAVRPDSLCLAQASSSLTARELYYVPAGAVSTKRAPASAAAPAKKKRAAANPQEIRTPSEIRLISANYSGPRPLGLRYAVLKRATDGDWQEVPADATFHSGDKLRIRVESNEDAFLYIVAKGTSGNWDVLFPSREIDGGDNRVSAGSEQVIPNRRGQWTLDDQKGEEQLFLVLSRHPVKDLDALIYDLEKGARPTSPVKAEEPATRPRPESLIYAQATINDGLVAHLRASMQARDLVFEKIDDQPAPQKGGQKETAVYVVEKSGRPDARLVADIRIRHE